jgi:hypothetical protein
LINHRNGLSPKSFSRRRRSTTANEHILCAAIGSDEAEALIHGLDIASRLVIGLSKGKVGWVLGTTALAVAKSIENMACRRTNISKASRWPTDAAAADVRVRVGVSAGRLSHAAAFLHCDCLAAVSTGLGCRNCTTIEL